MSFFSIFNANKNKLEKIKKQILKSNNKIEVADKEKVFGLLKPTIGVRTKAALDDKIPVGSSKIGGKPDIPPDFAWPTYNAKPLAFCAQYNCAELTDFDVENKLPHRGMLYVFIYIDQEWPGFLNKKGSYKVVYHEDNDGLVRAEFPPGFYRDGQFKAALIEYFEYYTLPDDENYKLDELNKEYSHFRSYHERILDFIDELCGRKEDSYHQLLGEDRSIQTSVVHDLATKALLIKTSEDYYSKQAEIDEVSREFVILIQLDFNDKNADLGRMGGTSVAYFGIKPQELLNKNFDNVVLAFQGT